MKIITLLTFSLLIFTCAESTVHQGDKYTVDGSGSVYVPFVTEENVNDFILSK